MQAFAAGNVPIYWGDPTAVEQFNEKAFINCCGLTIDEAVAKVKEVDNDDQLYLQMLNEKPLLDDQLREKTMEEFKNSFTTFLTRLLRKQKEFRFMAKWRCIMMHTENL